MKARARAVKHQRNQLPERAVSVAVDGGVAVMLIDRQRIGLAFERVLATHDPLFHPDGAWPPVSSAPVSCGKGNRPACVPAAASLYRGYLSCVPSILLSVAVLPEKVSCPIPAACSGVGTLLATSGHFVPKSDSLRCFPSRGIPFRTVILFSRCCPSMNYPKSTPK